MKLEGDLKKLLLSIFICWIILAIIFGFTILEISKALLNRDLIWTNIGKDFREGHSYGIIAIYFVFYFYFLPFLSKRV